MTFENKNFKKREEELDLLEKTCSKFGVKVEHVRELMELEKSKQKLLYRPGIHQDIKNKLKKFVNQKD